MVMFWPLTQQPWIGFYPTERSTSSVRSGTTVVPLRYHPSPFRDAERPTTTYSHLQYHCPTIPFYSKRHLGSRTCIRLKTFEHGGPNDMVRVPCHHRFSYRITFPYVVLATCWNATRCQFTPCSHTNYFPLSTGIHISNGLFSSCCSLLAFHLSALTYGSSSRHQ
ncbi:hypothetical protein JAAARDRAFT_623750 [Jaapia argillacea MUCL 33604]|uniref:Uncharacterized protein n=1 Tax=Jaapia argillacea MUCL 33604 TaxID=933084 RepID=A0A067PXT8_9AGAM|nr:hypothetical protein JAAARDRAFT_623750 [Jaapia argillacea MUCL 33604]